jgi:hypothetical protein
VINLKLTRPLATAISFLVDFAKSATANFLVVGCSRRFRNYLVSWQIVFNLIFWSSKNDALLPHS